MLRNFSLIFGLAQSQWTTWPTSFGVSDFQQLSGQLEQVLNDPAVTELLQDEDFQKFTISDGLSLITYFQDTNTCSAVLTSLFDTIDSVVEYEGYSDETSIFSKIGDVLENNIISNLGSSTSISNLGSMIKAVFDNTFVSTIFSMYTSDYLEETSILEQIDSIRYYGITNFCEQIKIDDEEDGVGTISELIEENTEDDKYISIGANINAVVVFIRKIIAENNMEFVEMMMNPEIDNSARLLQISLFIEDDIDAMNAWKVLSGHTKVFVSVIRDIVLEDIDLEFTVFSDVEDLLDDEFEFETDYDEGVGMTTFPTTTENYPSYPPPPPTEDFSEDYSSYRKRRDTFSDETEYEISNLASTTSAIQMQFLNAIKVAMVTLVERLDFSSCNDYEILLYNECLTEFFDELMESIDEIRIAVYCGTLEEPSLGETCNAWNDEYIDSIDTKEGLTDYLYSDDIDEYDENIGDEYTIKFDDSYEENIDDEYDENIDDEYGENIGDEYDENIGDEYTIKFDDSYGESLDEFLKEYDENIEDEYDENIGDEYDGSDGQYTLRFADELDGYEYTTDLYTTDLYYTHTTESSPTVYDEDIITTNYITTIAAITVILITLILAVVSCVRLCRRNKLYNKYDKLETESSYPSLDKRIDHV